MRNLDINPSLILLAGFLLVLIGAAIPWLIVLHILPSTYFLNFLSFGSTILGLLLGIIGAAYIVRGRKR